MKHLVTGKPVVNCMWASPALPPDFGGFDEWIGRVQGQLAVCKEFNIATMFFAVGWTTSSPTEWLYSSDPEIKVWRDWLYGSAFNVAEPCENIGGVAAEAANTDTSQLPASSANGSAGAAIDISGSGAYSFTDGYANQNFMDNATIGGFLSLRWDYVNGVLYTEPKPQGGPNVLNQSALVYSFQRGSGTCNSIAGRIIGTIKGVGSAVYVDLSTDGTTWQNVMSTVGTATETAFDLTANGGSMSGGQFYVRVSSVVPATPGAFVKLDSLQVNANRP